MIPANIIARYLAQVPRFIPHFKGSNERTLHATIQQVTGVPFRPKTPPRGKHQLEGVTLALYLQRALLFFDMRLGKSWLGVNWAEHLRRAGYWHPHKKCLVIVHAPIALDVWEAEVPKHSHLKAAIVRTRLDEFIDALESDADLVVIPWSGLQTIFAKKQSVKVHKLVNKKSTFVRENKLTADFDLINQAAEAFQLVIIDEIHKAKNKSTLRFKIATSLIQYCWFRLGLTGTPFGRDPFDLWGEVFLVDEGKTLGKNFNFFKQAFGVEKINKATGRKTFEFDEEKSPIFRMRLDSISMSYERSEVHDVNILYGDIELHMIGEQRAAYEAAIDRFIKITDNETGDLVAVFVRLRQISSGYLPFVDKEGNEREIIFPYNPKLEWLEAFCKDIPPIQIIIFHEFIRSGELICEVLKEAGITHARLYGATKNTAEVVAQFNTGQIQILVANTMKAGMAIDLPTADYIIYYESPTSPVTRQQADARPMSRGAKILTIDDMICSGVERRIKSFIIEGKDLLDNLVRAKRSLKDY